jgi:phosphoribosylanthranilate isomerase
VTLVKICGIRDARTALAAAEAGADFIGLVFAESRRQVTPQACHDIVEAITERRRLAPPPVDLGGPTRGEVSPRSWFPAWADAIELALARARPLVVGVFARMTAEEVNDIAEAARIDIVQLSGGEDDAFLRAVRRPVLRTIHVHDGDEPADITERIVPGLHAATLLDTASPGALGGTGTSFDWAIAEDVAARFPVVLAGGLTPANVAEAVRTVRPWAVDVSSGVETDAVKDPDKIRAFISAAKGVSRDH